MFFVFLTILCKNRLLLLSFDLDLVLQFRFHQVSLLSESVDFLSFFNGPILIILKNLGVPLSISHSNYFTVHLRSQLELWIDHLYRRIVRSTWFRPDTWGFWNMWFLVFLSIWVLFVWFLWVTHFLSTVSDDTISWSEVLLPDRSLLLHNLFDFLHDHVVEVFFSWWLHRVFGPELIYQ